MHIIPGWESPGDVERSEGGKLGKCMPSSHILLEAPQGADPSPLCLYSQSVEDTVRWKRPQW